MTTDQQQEARWHQVGDYICDCTDSRHGLQDQAWVGANRVNADEKRIAELADANEALRKDLQETGDNWVAQTAQLAGRIEVLRVENAALVKTLEALIADLQAAELRAEALATAIEAALRYAHGEMDCLDESGKAVCRASAHRMFGILLAALDAYRATD